MPGVQRVARSMLILPKTETTVSNLLCFIKFLSSKTAAPREELNASIKELRAQVWAINDAVGRTTNFKSGQKVPVAPMSIALRRALAALDQIDTLIPKDC